MKSAMILMFWAEPWEKVLRSTGRKDSSVRPSKPGPNSISGEPPWQVPRSPVTVAAVLVLLLVVVEDDDIVVVAVSAAEVVVVAEVWQVEPVAALLVEAPVEEEELAEVLVEEEPVEALAENPAAATAWLISSSVTSGTRRFWVKMHPSGSFASSPGIIHEVRIWITHGRRLVDSTREALTTIAFGRRVPNLSRGKRSAVNRPQRIAANAGDLNRQIQRDLLVVIRGTVRGRVLVLREGRDLRVHGLQARAERALLPDGSRVPLQGPENEGVGHALDVSIGFGIREGLVGDCLLEAVEIGNGASTGGGSLGRERLDP